MTEQYNKLADTEAIEQFMIGFGQTVRNTPTTDVSDKDRILRGRLIVEETLEMLEALGLTLALGAETPRPVDPKDFVIEVDDTAPVDLVGVADAASDLIVVTKGTASTYGIPIDQITLEEVMPSNMSKFDKDGNPIYHPETGKIVKSDQFFEPNIERSLRAAGWTP